jgi:hypothetical protein
MLGLQNILQKKKKKLLQKVMWHNIIENEINLNFEKFNHVVQHHFVSLFFFFLVKYFVTLAFLNEK